MEIISGIHQIRGRFVNCYLVLNDNGIMLIDTGMPGTSSKIISYVEENLKRNPQDIKSIVITQI